jgi:hypothetical protein
VVLRLALWSLAEAPATLEELRNLLGDEPATAPGLLFGAWVSDEASDRFGFVQLWETRDGAEAPLPPGLRELIGGDPPIAELFDVEATASVVSELQHLGLAFT